MMTSLSLAATLPGAPASRVYASGSAQGTTPDGVQRAGTVTPLFERDLPCTRGKMISIAKVVHLLGRKWASHTHPKAAFGSDHAVSGGIIGAVDKDEPRAFCAGKDWHEAAGSHHPVSRNASMIERAKIIAIFIADPRNGQLVFRDPERRAPSGPCGTGGVAACATASRHPPLADVIPGPPPAELGMPSGLCATKRLCGSGGQGRRV